MPRWFPGGAVALEIGYGIIEDHKLSGEALMPAVNISSVAFRPSISMESNEESAVQHRLTLILR